MSNGTYTERIVSRRPFGWEFVNEKEAPIHFSFEEVDPFYWNEFISANWALAFYAGFIYILTIIGLQNWMRTRPAYDLKGALFWWNLSLGIFSVLGFARTLPDFLYVLRSEGGFYTSICVKKLATIPFGFWILAFILSKFVELGDTVFIILRKRPLIFLQWYHHVITMTVTWIIAPHMEPVTKWYTVMNYLVHALMYNYFALKAKGFRIPSYVANLITTLQLAQMIIGFSVNMLSLHYYQTGHDCARYPSSIKAFSVVYGSFLILFGKLFYDTVFKGGRRQRDQHPKKID